MFTNFEAYDETNGHSIYNGSSKTEMILELIDYIEFQNHINEEIITEEQIRDLDRNQLKKVGIIIFVN